jgi:hypothetical protein
MLEFLEVGWEHLAPVFSRRVEHHQQFCSLRADIAQLMDDGGIEMQRVSRAQGVLVFPHHHFYLSFQDVMEFFAQVLVADTLMVRHGINENLEGL